MVRVWRAGEGRFATFLVRPDVSQVELTTGVCTRPAEREIRAVVKSLSQMAMAMAMAIVVVSLVSELSMQKRRRGP